MQTCSYILIYLFTQRSKTGWRGEEKGRNDAAKSWERDGTEIDADGEGTETPREGTCK